MSFILISLFIIGYLLIVFEHKIKLDKAATALITGVLCWVVFIVGTEDKTAVNYQLAEHIGKIAGILFFLIGAMTIVELIDLYDGFQLIIERIKTKKKGVLLIIVTLLSFFLSAILDNLTTAIVMSSLIVKLMEHRQDRLYLIGMIIIAANAGGAWSPIGDVTTTMLWIGSQITATGVMKTVFLPSLVATIVPMIYFLTKMKGEFISRVVERPVHINKREQSFMLYAGITLLLFVPAFKTLTHLPPFMGMMLAVGIVWAISETLHKRKDSHANNPSSIFSALERIDLPSILFFMGILLAVSALESANLLSQSASFLQTSIGNDTLLVTGIGLLSAIFDNVPLVAAMQGMFNLETYSGGHFFWNYLAYCSGTGGSILIIGSAAGVAAMGIEKISFFWYLKHISLAALLGFLAGAALFVIL